MSMSMISDALFMAKMTAHEVLWLLQSALQLIGAMGSGVKWMIMAVRLISFAMLDMIFFIPHVLWYILSPTVIRRVSYRSSPATKARNLRAVIQREKKRSSRAALKSTMKQASKSNLLSATRESGSDADDIDTEMLATHLNPADGSALGGIPVAADSSPLDISTLSGFSMNSSFSEAMQLLNQYNSARKKENLGASRSQSMKDSCRSMSHGSEESDEDDIGSQDEFSKIAQTFDEEDKLNMHNRAFLDIYLPVPMDTLFRVLSDAAKPQKEFATKKFPILICVNGGAWIVGFYLWNFLIARLFAARGYVVFCPDYRNFPQATMEDMVLDVSDAIAWVLKNAERYNGDLKHVTLMGQSAGAHLSMMSLISQAHISSYGAGDAGQEPIPPPSPQAYNVFRYNPRTSIHHYIGLSGIYNIRALTKHFDSRGLYVSVLYQIAGGKSKMPRFSPPAYFEEGCANVTGETLPHNILDFLPKRMSFVHGDADKSAPLSESANMVSAIQDLQRIRMASLLSGKSKIELASRVDPIEVGYYVVPGATHTDAIIDEVLSCGKSHIVDFLVAVQSRDKKSKKSHGDHTHPLVTFDVTADKTYAGVSKRPDGIIRSPAPYSDRPILVQLAGSMCPF